MVAKSAEHVLGRRTFARVLPGERAVVVLQPERESPAAVLVGAAFRVGEVRVDFGGGDGREREARDEAREVVRETVEVRGGVCELCRLAEAHKKHLIRRKDAPDRKSVV